MSTSPKGHKAVFVAILLLTIVAVGLAFTGSVAADTGSDSNGEIEAGDTITVNASDTEDDSTFTSIQDAIDAAESDQHILVEPGTYEGDPSTPTE